MVGKNVLFKLLVQPITRWAARQTLVGRNRSRMDLRKGRFSRSDVEHLLDETWRAFERMAVDVSSEPTFGSRMNVQLAAVTLAFFQSLQSAGVSTDEAIELVGDVSWKIYQMWGRYGQLIRRWFHTDPIIGHEKRVGKDGSWPIAFPFNPPGYLARYCPIEGGIGFDVVHCPVAAFFRMHHASELGLHTWCMLDYPLAEMIDFHLTRTQTLMDGDPICDFRWARASQKLEKAGQHEGGKHPVE